MFVKFLITFLLAVSCSAFVPRSGIRIIRPGPVVSTLNGAIQGHIETVDVFRSHLSFKGIPYGAPPTGDRRFRAPIRSEPWTGVRQAFHHGSNCPQLHITSGEFSGDEDCLFLNVYTPTTIRNSLPVMVDIHAGAFFYGSGDTDTLGPELLLQENIIYVSFNYRIDVLGFLNTGDQHVPGNSGLKDMILALQWIQENVAFFGGNPNDVTIMGASTGGSAVHALVLSEQSRGLFHKALSHSSTLFNIWAMNHHPETAVEQLIRNLELTPTSNENLVEQLRAIPVEDLLRAALNEETNIKVDSLPFVLTVEAEDSLEPRVITDTPTEMIRAGNFNRVPYMIGFNGGESLLSLATVRDDPTIFNLVNEDPYLIVPTEWNVPRDSPAADDIIQSVRELYFDGQVTLDTEMAWQWSNYISDREFIFAVSKTANLHADLQPTYYFKFSYSGSLSVIQLFAGLLEFPGANNSDDGFYLNRINLPFVLAQPSDHAFKISRIMVRLWSNFAKFGKPTPNILDPITESITWPLMTSANNEFMEIGGRSGNDLQNSTLPFQKRMELWNRLDQLYNRE